MSRYTAQQVAEAKAGTTLSQILGETAKLFRAGPGRWVTLCPLHDEKSPSFYVYEDHYHCFGCGAHGDAIDWLVKVRKMPFTTALTHLGATPRGGRPQAIHESQPPPPPRSSVTLDAARRIWSEALPARGTVVERYLQCRGLILPTCAEIRFHPACQRGPRDGRGIATLAAAMICLMRDPRTGHPTGVHRTYLTASGSKAANGGPAPPAKSILGRWGSISIPSEDEIDSDRIAISEGLENGLSARVLLGWDGPVQAAGCQAGITSFPVLTGIRHLTIFADGDPVGVRAAEACANRWRKAGRGAEILQPTSGDWNDELRRRLR